MDGYADPHPAAFGVGSLLSRSWSALMARPGFFLGLGVIACLPEMLGIILSRNVPGAQLWALALQGAVAYGLFQTLRGEPVRIGEAVFKGLRRILSIIVVAILAGLCIMGGMILLIVPGVIISCALSMIIPVCVVERLGAFACLRRSAELTKGRRWTIFAVFIAAFLLYLATLFILVFVSSLIAGPGSLNFAMAVIGIPATAFWNILIAMVYYELRAAKEGVSLDSLVSVFD